MLRFSRSAQGMRSSEIRRLMKLAADPAIISFAGGMPNNELFPVDVLDTLYAALSVERKQAGFQYSPTSGYPPLLESLREYLRTRGLPVDSERLIVTTGAQQAINLLTKVFIDPGDRIITEYPSFIGAVAAFTSYGAELLDCPMDEEGIEVNRLAAALGGESAPAPKMVYLSPCFHNPAGITYSEDRKRAVLETLRDTETVLLEDDPYSELYFHEEDKPLTTPMKSMDESGVTGCYVGSLAKIFGPGMRLGYILASPEIIEKCELAKQSMDACSSTFTQVLADRFLRSGTMPGYLAGLRQAYARRADKMLRGLKEHMPQGVRWTTPRGGFYIWVTLPEGTDSSAVFEGALRRGAAFVIGSAFDPQGIRNNSFRLAFSHTPEEKIETGVKMVCDAVREVLE